MAEKSYHAILNDLTTLNEDEIIERLREIEEEKRVLTALLQMKQALSTKPKRRAKETVKCPECGRTYRAQSLTNGLIPAHTHPQGTKAVCAGAYQHPRGMADKRPLWSKRGGNESTRNQPSSGESAENRPESDD